MPSTTPLTLAQNAIDNTLNYYQAVNSELTRQRAHQLALRNEQTQLITNAFQLGEEAKLNRIRAKDIAADNLRADRQLSLAESRSEQELNLAERKFKLDERGFSLEEKVKEQQLDYYETRDKITRVEAYTELATKQQGELVKSLKANPLLTTQEEIDREEKKYLDMRREAIDYGSKSLGLDPPLPKREPTISEEPLGGGLLPAIDTGIAPSPEEIVSSITPDLARKRVNDAFINAEPNKFGNPSNLNEIYQFAKKSNVGTDLEESAVMKLKLAFGKEATADTQGERLQARDFATQIFGPVKTDSEIEKIVLGIGKAITPEEINKTIKDIGEFTAKRDDLTTKLEDAESAPESELQARNKANLIQSISTYDNIISTLNNRLLQQPEDRPDTLEPPQQRGLIPGGSVIDFFQQPSRLYSPQAQFNLRYEKAATEAVSRAEQGDVSSTDFSDLKVKSSGVTADFSDLAGIDISESEFKSKAKSRAKQFATESYDKMSPAEKATIADQFKIMEPTSGEFREGGLFGFGLGSEPKKLPATPSNIRNWYIEEKTANTLENISLKFRQRKSQLRNDTYQAAKTLLGE